MFLAKINKTIRITAYIHTQKPVSVAEARAVLDAEAKTVTEQVVIGHSMGVPWSGKKT